MIDINTNIKQQINILKSLENNSQLSQRQMAKDFGISLGKINYCLNSLIDKGFIKVANFKNSNNKIKYAYLLTSQGIQEKTLLTKQFLKMRIDEYEQLKTEIEILKKEVVL